MSPKKSCLFVAYAYPPISSPGAVRATRLLKMLDQFGWIGQVVTVQDGYSLRQGGLSDPLADQPSRVIRVNDPIAQLAGGKTLTAGSGHTAEGVRPNWIKRVVASTLGHFKRLLFPDRGILWVLVAAIVRKDREFPDIDLVHSTSPNQSSHILGWAIARRRKIPWVAEFRDPISWLPDEQSDSYVRRKLLAKYEAWVVNKADVTVVVSEAFAEYFRSIYPRRKIVAIPNGVEFDIDEVVRRLELRQQRPALSPVRLVHTGSLYAGARKPGPLIEAAKRARDVYGVSVLVEFAGEDTQIAIEAANLLACRDLVKVHDTLTHSATQELLRSADATVALLHDDRIAQIGIMSKFFDYLPTGAPILCIGDANAMLSRIVQQDELGVAFLYSDIDQMARWIADLPGMRAPKTLDACEKWSSKQMALNVSELFDDVLMQSK
ncbi:MAG: glycosyltransferase [Pseudomonadota bacterium]